MPPVKKLAGIPQGTDMSIGYELPTYDNKSGSTKVKNDQVDYHYCKKVSDK